MEGARVNYIEYQGLTHYYQKYLSSDEIKCKVHLITFDPSREVINDDYQRHLILQRLAEIKLQENIGKEMMGNRLAMKSDLLGSVPIATTLQEMCPM